MHTDTSPAGAADPDEKPGTRHRPAGAADPDEMPGARRRPERLLRGASKDGVVLRPAALSAGVTRSEIEKELERGFMDEVGKGVYLLAGRPLTGAAAFRAALASARSEALGLFSALGGLGANRGIAPVRVQVLIPHSRKVHSPAWFYAHRTRRLEEEDIVQRDGVPMSSGARAIRDLVATMPATPWADRQITRSIEECLLVRATSIEKLEAMSAREKAAQVRNRLDRLIDHQRGHDPALFRSECEKWLRALCLRLGLPMPQFNVTPPGAGGEVDAFLEFVPLIIEFDGFTTHRTRTAFDSDRRRDRIALRNGIATLRLTKTDYDLDLPQLERDIEQLVLGSGKVARR